MEILKIRPHEILDTTYDGIGAIKLLGNPYNGLIFTYGKVEFIPGEDELKLKFQYTIRDSNGISYDKEELKNYLGDFLQELILQGIEENNLTYTGGIDEVRAEDTF